MQSKTRTPCCDERSEQPCQHLGSGWADRRYENHVRKLSDHILRYALWRRGCHLILNGSEDDDEFIRRLVEAARAPLSSHRT